MLLEFGKKSRTIHPGDFRNKCTEKLNWALKINKNTPEECKKKKIPGKRISMLESKNSFAMFRDEHVIMKIHKIIYEPDKKFALPILSPLGADIFSPESEISSSFLIFMFS